jgi:nucleotide-binding universal stress UspA family protein
MCAMRRADNSSLKLAPVSGVRKRRSIVSNVFFRILVAIDDSNASNEAVAFASRLAREHDGQLIFCHSADWLPVITNLAESGMAGDTSEIIDDLKQEGEVLLDRAMRAAQRIGVHAQRHLFEGNPAECILEFAADAKCSLIVMGTHDRSGLERLFVGSTTEAVLRGSAVPVLTLRSGTKRTEATRRCFECIVVGTDESEPSDAAIATVLEWGPGERQQVLFYCVAGVGDDEQEQARRVVHKALASANARGVSAEGRVIGGNPGEALITAAQQRSADLIVVGSHGRHGLQRLFLGSVAEHVVRHAPIPVLVVRTRESVPLASAPTTKHETSRV